MKTTRSSKDSSPQDILNDYATRYEQLLASQRGLEKELYGLEQVMNKSETTNIPNNKSVKVPLQATASIVVQNAAMNGMIVSAIETCKRNVNIPQDSIDSLVCLWHHHQALYQEQQQNNTKWNSKRSLNYFGTLAMQQRNETSSLSSLLASSSSLWNPKETSLEDFFQAFPECEEPQHGKDSFLELEYPGSNDNTHVSSNPSWTNPYVSHETRKLPTQSKHSSHTKSFSSNTVNDITTNNNNHTSGATSSSWDSYTNNSNHPNQEKVNAFCTASEVKIHHDTSKHNNNDTTTYEYESTPPPPSSSFHTQIPSSSSTTSQYNPHRPNLTAGLKKKFQLPKPRSSTTNNTSLQQNNHHKRQAATTNGTNNDNGNNDQELPEELQHLDAELVRKIENEICDSGDPITFQDIAGLKDAKQTVMELVCWPMKRPDLFTGLRRGPNGLLLFGPPGTGKTLIGKAIAHESGATFFSISSSSLTSKWIGEGEKLVRTLFAVAAYREPAVVFIDEIDSLLTQRKSDENEASRRIKTEFLVQLDGTGTSGQGRVLVIGATNRPHELDDAARRRFVKRLYIPLPEAPDREILLRTLLSKNHHSLTDKDVQKLSNETAGFSGADLKALCTDAALGPIRQLGHRALEVSASDVPPISYKHFRHALKGMNPSVAQSDLDIYLDFNKTYGSKSVTAEDYDGLSDEEEEAD